MSADRATSISIDSLPGYGPAFTALAGGTGDEPGGLVTTGELAGAAARRAEATVHDEERQELWTAVNAGATRLGASMAARSALTELQAGAPIVICGQQPGLLGGPAFTLYKIATCIALAGRLRRTWGRPVVPVFWNTTYDTDFVEIASAGMARHDHRLERLELDAGLHRDHLMVGALPVAAARSLMPDLRRTLADLPGAAAVESAVAVAWERGSDWGEGFTALLYHLFAEHRLVVIDGRLPLLRRLARPLIARYLDRVAEFARLVEAQTAHLMAAGWERQLTSRATGWSLMIESGEQRYSFDDAYPGDGPVPGSASPASSATAATPTADDPAARATRHAPRAVEILAGRAPGVLWPGVALRPLVADHLLPTVAHVMGPAEVAYMSQLVPAYQLLDLTLPPIMPRLCMTWVPPALLAAAAAAGLDPAELVGAPAAAADRLAADSGGAAARAAVAALGQTVKQEFARHRKDLLSAGRGIEELVAAVQGRIVFQLDRLRDAVAQRQRAALRRQRPELGAELELIAPRQRLQERQLAWLGLHALVGPGLTERVLAMAGRQVDRALAGEPAAHQIMPLEVDER